VLQFRGTCIVHSLDVAYLIRFYAYCCGYDKSIVAKHHKYQAAETVKPFSLQFIKYQYDNPQQVRISVFMTFQFYSVLRAPTFFL
jgi:hypothetical protein